MSYHLVTKPQGEPVSVVDAKLFLRVEDDCDDALIAALVSAARELCETFTNRKFLTQTWQMNLDAFPTYLDRRNAAAQGIKAWGTGAWFWAEGNWGFMLPFGPVSAVTSLAYNDQYGNPQTLQLGTNYTTDILATPARVLPAWPTFWPLSQYAPNAISCTFVCGYGAQADVPNSILLAIKMLVREWYEGRGMDVEGKGRAMSPAVETLLWQFRDERPN